MEELIKNIRNSLKTFWYINIVQEPVTLVIPAYNEGTRIGKVLDVAKKSRLITEILVVDDGSEDDTAKIAENAGAKVIKHGKNKGKGAAMRTGIKNSSSDVILFLDADIKNLKPAIVDNLIIPVIGREADFVKGMFDLERGRVTELTVKPILKSLFPDINLSQPISGQFCARKSFLETLEIKDDWGIDISILIDATQKGLKIEEVEMGKLEHKERPMHEKIKMAEEVTKTIFEKAGLIKKYELIVFDLDGTLIKERSIDYFAKKYGFHKRLLTLRKKLIAGKASELQMANHLAKEFTDKTAQDIEKVCEEIHIVKNAKEVIDKLKERRYRIYIVSQAFSPIVRYFAKKLGVENFICPELVEKDGKFTGEVTMPVFENSSCKYHGKDGCKAEELKLVAKKNKVEMRHTVAVGDSRGDICMLEASELGILIGKSKDTRRAANIQIDNMAELLLYV